jgi:DNA (cytosine-5)-methyltransferase 1
MFDPTEEKLPGTMISLFTGAMGLDLGFELEGFETRVIVENDRAAVDTIQLNRPGIPVIMRENGKHGSRPASIEDISTDELLQAAGLGIEDTTVLIGAPPCEPYSTAGRRNGKADHRADGIVEFIRVIKEARPRYFVLEEVDSFLSSAIRHIPFYERIRKTEDELAPEERLGSFFNEVMAAFADTGYSLSFDPENPKGCILNAVDFGVAQKRKRFILIGSREGPTIRLPVRNKIQPKTFGQILNEINDPSPEYSNFSPSWGQYLPLVPPGGCWRDLPKDIQRIVLGGAYDDPDNTYTKGKKGGRTGFMRRLSRGLPSPTLVDSPTTKAACMCHPDENRPLSVREYAALQGFPQHWLFQGSIAAKYRLIGQATPVPLAQAIAKSINESMDSQSQSIITITTPDTLT